jgi:hypothetical protein
MMSTIPSRIWPSVCATPDGTACGPNWTIKAIQRHLPAAGLRPFRLHDLRHSMARSTAREALSGASRTRWLTVPTRCRFALTLGLRSNTSVTLAGGFDGSLRGRPLLLAVILICQNGHAALLKFDVRLAAQHVFITLGEHSLNRWRLISSVLRPRCGVPLAAEVRVVPAGFASCQVTCS